MEDKHIRYIIGLSYIFRKDTDIYVALPMFKRPNFITHFQSYSCRHMIA